MYYRHMQSFLQLYGIATAGRPNRFFVRSGVAVYTAFAMIAESPNDGQYRQSATPHWSVPKQAT